MKVDAPVGMGFVHLVMFSMEHGHPLARHCPLLLSSASHLSSVGNLGKKGLCRQLFIQSSQGRVLTWLPSSLDIERMNAWAFSPQGLFTDCSLGWVCCLFLLSRSLKTPPFPSPFYSHPTFSNISHCAMPGLLPVSEATHGTCLFLPCTVDRPSCLPSVVSQLALTMWSLLSEFEV